MNDRPPRLAFLCLQPTVEGQGSHAHVWGIVNGLRARGWRVVVFEPALDTRRAGLLTRLWESLTTQWRLFRHAHGADAVYVRMHPMAAPAVRWARSRGIRAVVEVNGPAEDWEVAWPVLRYAPWLLRGLIRDQLRHADHVVVVTTGLAAWARRMTGDDTLPVAVIPNGVDTDRFFPGATGGPQNLPNRYAVFVGELAAWQGIEDLVGAFLHPAWPDGLDLVVAGEGAEEWRLEEVPVIDGRQLHRLGRVPHEQVPGLLAGATVALVTSRDRVGTGIAPLKLFEALACDVPVVGGDLADIDRYLAWPRVAPGDPGGWARAVAALVTDCEEQSNPARPADEHSWSERAARTASLLTR